MNEYFDGFWSGPRSARRPKAHTSRTHAKVHHVTDGFFDGFFAGPRAAR